VFCNNDIMWIGQCFGGFETYEKTTGMAMSEGDPQGLLHQPGAAVTRDCTAVCRQSTTCKAFTVGKDNVEIITGFRYEILRRKSNNNANVTFMRL